MKKKELFKKCIALLGCLTMTLSVVGCGQTPSNESTAQKESPQVESITETSSVATEVVEEGDDTIVIYLNGQARPDLGKVSDALSELVKDKIGFGVELVQFGSGSEYYQKMPLHIASPDVQVDIVWDSQDSFVSGVKNGSYMDVSELLESAPKLKEVVYDELWKGVTMNGGIYGVPVVKEIAEQWAVLLNKDFIEKSNIDTTKVTKLADLEVILEALKADGRVGFMIGNKNVHEPMAWMDTYDKIVDSFYVPVDGEDVVCWYMTEDYDEYVNLMRDWFNKGYIRSDIAVNEDYAEFQADPTKLGMDYCSYTPYAEAKYTGDDERVAVTVTGNAITNTSARGSIFCIPSTTKNAKKAIQFLELLNTDSEVKNLITYGIEGEHYTLVDGKVQYVENYKKLYYQQNARVGNNLISYLLVGEPDDKWDEYGEFNQSARASKVLGFNPDTSTLDAEYTAVRAVVEEYANLLSCGAIEPEKHLPVFREALKDAGVQKIVDELQKQYDAWKSAK